MAIISFWSNTKKETGQTLSLVAMATAMAIEHNNRILIISTKYNDNTLELCFGATANNHSLVKSLLKTAPVATLDNGIEGLYKSAYSGRLTPEIIPNYTHVIYKNRLEILYGYQQTEDKESSQQQYERIKEEYKIIIQNAAKYYDMVFVDLEKGIDDKLNRELLAISDIIVVNVQQKIDMINNFKEIKSELGQKNNIILNIGKFDGFSKYSVKNISRYVGMKRDITAIPYNTLFFEAANEEKVADLFLRLRKVDEMDRNSVFMKASKEAVEKLIYKMQELQMKI